MPELNQTISHYRIVEKIGEGGMGEVYLADDTTLDRKVALKFLPEAFTRDPERMARFEREAKLLASLNHPNIAGIHGLEQTDGNRFLVLEYVEGETLQARLSKGALPLEGALELCRQIAEGLEAAHEKGVIHRDLKPANVMITAEEKVKILDFGLAKAFSDDTQSIDSSQSPTLTEAMTQPGVILGTAAYMSPEQAKGKSVDKRADIWAFGCILYECLTGRKAFEGDTVTETLAAIIKEKPSLDKAPVKVWALLNGCLQKDPSLRLRDIGDAWQLLESAPETASGLVRSKGPWLVWASITFILAIALIALSLLYFRGEEPVEVIRFDIPVPSMPGDNSIAISPDGRMIAYVASPSGLTNKLFIREIGSVTPQPLSGTEGASFPFWSPDSRSIAFFAGGRLSRIDVSGGSPRDICGGSGMGGTWNKDGDILFADWPVLRRVSAEGGELTDIKIPDASQNEISCILPHFLPDGRHYLFTVTFGNLTTGIYMGALDSDVKTKLLSVDSAAVYAEPGYLIYQNGRTLFAQPFDLRNLELTGKSVSIADGLLVARDGLAHFSVSNKGVLACRTSSVRSHSQFLWFDRNGNQLELAGPAGTYDQVFDLSPDGRSIAVSQTNPATSSNDIWLIEWQRNVSAQITFDLIIGGDIAWSPDGLRIASSSMRRGSSDIFEINSSGVGEETMLIESSAHEWIEDWSQDGQYIAYGSGLGSEVDIYILPISGDERPFPIVQSPGHQDEPRFSFDGKWLAYDSNESGTWQTYVVSFPAADQKIQMSTDGGGQPRWRRDGKEFYYLALNGKMMAVDIKGGVKFEPSIPRVLFNTELNVSPNLDQYAVTPDGQRFLLLKPSTEAASTPITVTLNWPSLIKK